MTSKISRFRGLAIFCLIWGVGVCPVFGGNLKTLHGHVPAITKQLQSTGNWPATNQLWLAIGLPLRDPAGLSNFLAEVYNPASPNYRHYLTPEEFTARFGPTPEDYAAVRSFAQANNFQITATHDDRLLLDVRANVADIQRAFHLNLRKFKHPREVRDFYAPDAEPTVDVALPVVDITGLNNYVLPYPKLVKKQAVAGKVVGRYGSAPDGYSYIGDDFRAAYLPGTTLTGAGQSVGLLEFDGFYSNDVKAYAQAAGGGRTSIAIQTVLLDGYSGVPTTGRNSGNSEVALDIEMAMAMAPGLTKIISFTGGPNGNENDVLSAMASNNAVKNLSCSWGWGGGPSATTDAIFQKMMMQGQSFFNAAGDSCAFTTGVTSANGVDNPNNQNAPSSSPYITQVGGTTLVTTGPGGAWQSESVWNWGGGTGSGGGISSYYAIPFWQTNVSMASNQGSTTQRNIPDVALTADNVYTYSDNGSSGSVGGTSCAAPLWAGLTALANEQADDNGQPAVGFINPVIYALGSTPNYTANFHDITDGDNTWSSSTSQFYAVSGYDLCTGWGTPMGQNLIDALAGQIGLVTNYLKIVSNPQITAAGAVGGPFNITNSTITLSNSGPSPLTWTLLNPNAVTWLKISPASGVLDSQTTTDLEVNFTAAVSNLAVGNYSASFQFSNSTAAARRFVTFHLQVVPVISVVPTTGFSAVGPVGGAFAPATKNFTLSNLGGTNFVWKVVESSAWLAVSPISGTLPGSSQTNFTISVTTNANKLKAGIYKTTVTLRNSKNKILQSFPFTLSIGQSIVANGGFETGDFTGWTLDAATTVVGKDKGLVHSGKYGAELGQGSSLGYLSQTVPTLAGQTYQVSLWLSVPKNSTSTNATPNEFQVQWEGATIYDGVNLPFMAWTNLQFTVTASDSGSLLQFGFRDDPYYLGLDDITVKPIAVPHVLSAAPQLRAIVQSSSVFNFTFDTTPGATYQAQYKTNLLQPDWIDLGTPILSETNTLKFTDADIANYPQKFYRLKLVP